MQVKYMNILDVPYGVICQQVNCQGVMGSGLAKHILDKWPQVKKDYIAFVNEMKLRGGANYHPGDLLGSVVFTQVEPNIHVACIFGQENYGRNKSVVYTDYDALEEGLHKVIANARNYNMGPITVPFQIGCGLANGDWSYVTTRIEQLELRESTMINVAKLN